MFTEYFKSAQNVVSAQLKYWNAMRELNSLSDMELRDLGINRYEIEQVAREASVKQMMPSRAW